MTSSSEAERAADEAAAAIEALLERASVLAECDDAELARELAETALRLASETFGDRTPDAASTRVACARIALTTDDATRALALALRARGDASPEEGADHDVARVAIHAALVASEATGRLGRLEDAQHHADDALSLAARHLAREDEAHLEALNAAGVARKFAGDLEGAEAAYRTLRELLTARGELGTELEATLAHNEAGLLHSRGEHARALPLAWRAASLRAELCGEDCVAVAADLAQLGTVLLELGHAGPAETAHRRALWVFHRAHGRSHPEVAYGWNELAGVAHEQGRLALAERRYVRAARLRAALLGEAHPDVAVTLASLAIVQRDRGARREARETIERAYRIARSALGTEHPITRACAKNRAALRG